MLELLNEFAALLRGALDSPWLWLLIFAVAGLDALLPFMPSESSVMAVAVLLGPDFPALAALTAVAACGALAGDLLGHGVGRLAGPRTLRRLHRNEKGRRTYEWARRKVYRHATLLVVAGRYVPGGRVASALATGSLRFPLARFAALDAVGVTIWAVYAVAVGYAGAAGFADDPAKGLLVAFGLGLLVLGCVELGRRIVSRRGLRDLPTGRREPLRRAAGRGDRGRSPGSGTHVSELDCAQARAAHREGPVVGRRGHRTS
ncbi:membrane protein DedA with SNARE-associated domain [Saccharomonospora amisosensis]|uniref:Membrane protein DedA with SNARE-associated domain n=1 Tax=Saccharomonospora amisosensis TaxID=1128677 RepID=A0A7X5UV29_9PSEU|nr:VTT domain-containing protein [Saccharomonospora amisosensis]NIJ14718.1 membrane protein DedA with SNARE-associated domain [Saccharomonospora amisosensis]